MTSPLLDPLRHNSWATRQLIGFCRDKLSPDQLRATSEGTYGTILGTLQHIVAAEEGYGSRLAGRTPTRAADETEDLGELERMNDDNARSWEDLVDGDFDPDRDIEVPSPLHGDPFGMKAGLLVAQSLNHGNEHRAQIFTILTTLGVEPPELDGWSWGLATGRFWYLESP